MQIPHSESELHGLCAIAESTLKQISKVRKTAPVSVQQAVEKSHTNYRGSCVVYFQNRTAALSEKNITALIDGAMEQVNQYSRCANPRYPCSAFNDLIKTFNVPEIDLSDKWTKHKWHKQYTYNQDGSVASTHKCIVDPYRQLCVCCYSLQLPYSFRRYFAFLRYFVSTVVCNIACSIAFSSGTGFMICGMAAVAVCEALLTVGRCLQCCAGLCQFRCLTGFFRLRLYACIRLIWTLWPASPSHFT
jgi:hypothetical protein